MLNFINEIFNAVRLLNDYYTNVLKKTIDLSSIDANAIGNDSLVYDSCATQLTLIIAAKSNSEDDIFDLLEVIMGCAVLCENKAKFIQSIFSLDHSYQAVLKGLIERVMSRVSDVVSNEGKSHDDHNQELSDDNLM